jgi:hypothetical protein
MTFACIRHGRVGALLPGLLLLRQPARFVGGVEVIRAELFGAHPEGRKLAQPCRERTVRDLSRMQLLFDVGGQADLLHAIDVTRTRAETDPVQHVRDGSVVGLGGHTGALGPSEICVERGREQAGEGRDRDHEA